MATHAISVGSTLTQRTPKARHTGRVVPQRVDAAKRRAALSYLTVQVSPKQGAHAIGVDRRNWERRQDGQHHSPLSRCAEEALRLEQAGIDSSFMNVHLHANAMMPELRTRSREEIEGELQRLYLEEQSANGCFDQVQMRDLSDGRMATPGLRDELRRCAMEQAAKSTRIVALIDRLNEMDHGGVL